MIYYKCNECSNDKDFIIKQSWSIDGKEMIESTVECGECGSIDILTYETE